MSFKRPKLAAIEMIDWRQGGWTGSLNVWVRREIKKHFRENRTARRCRYRRIIRLAHHIFDSGTFGRFVTAYAVVALSIVSCEALAAAYAPDLLPQWTSATDIKPLLTNVASYLISAQVGLLSVISIAIGLVTIIAQRESASTDVQVYYHESFAFGIVASSIALVVALCGQLFWPAHFALHWSGYGTNLQAFKIGLTALHIAWLLINLCAIAHFVAVTLGFVQQSSRESLRERYTTNVVLPIELRKRLRQQLFFVAGPEFVKEFSSNSNAANDPAVYLGQNFSNMGEVEIALEPTSRLFLSDVRMTWVRWVVGRWLIRCRAAPPKAAPRAVAGLSVDPILLFPPRLDDAARVADGLCRRTGGLPLTWIEKFVLRRAFKFGKAPDET